MVAGRLRERNQRSGGSQSPQKKCWTCRRNRLQRDCPEYAQERRGDRRYLNERSRDGREPSLERNQDGRLQNQQRERNRREKPRMEIPDGYSRDQGNGR